MHETVTLEKIKIATIKRVSEHLLDPSVTFSDVDGFISDDIDIMVKGYIWGETGKTETIRYPRTWWDAFKVRWFSAGMIAHWPADFTIHEISTKTLYPNFKISLPRETSVLKWQGHKYSELSALAEMRAEFGD